MAALNKSSRLCKLIVIKGFFASYVNFFKKILTIGNKFFYNNTVYELNMFNFKEHKKMNAIIRMISLLLVLVAGYIDAAVPPVAGGEQLGKSGTASQLAEIRKVRYLKSMYEADWNVPENITRIAKNVGEIFANNIATQQALRAKLEAALDRASHDGDVEWVKAAEPLLKKYYPSEYDALVGALLAPQKETEAQALEAEKERVRIEKEKKDIQATLAESFKKILMKSKAEREYAQHLAFIYSKITGLTTSNERANLKLLESLVERSANVQDFLEVLRDVIGKNEEIMNVVGDEVKMIVSNLLYRIAKPHADITQEDAMVAFIHASVSKDFGAMINIYRDLLNAENKKVASLEAFRMLKDAVMHHDTQAIVDLYKHFLMNSNHQGAALGMIFEYFMEQVRTMEERLAQSELIEPNESLAKLSAVFADTVYMPEVLPALRTFTGAKTLMSLDLLDEYSAAQVNRDVEALLRLRTSLIEAGISGDLIDAQIISMGGQPPEAVGPSAVPVVQKPGKPIGAEELSQALARAMEQQQAGAAKQNIQERWNAARKTGNVGELIELREEAVKAHVVDPMLEMPLDADLARAILESFQ